VRISDGETPRLGAFEYLVQFFAAFVGEAAVGIAALEDRSSAIP